MEITKEYLDSLVGKKVTCRIHDAFIGEAAIQKQDDKYYICQDIKDGSLCRNRLGYRYSWCTLSPKYSSSDYSVKDIKLKCTNDIKDGVVYGDLLRRSFDDDDELVKVLGICGDAIIMSNSGEYEVVGDLYTLQELIDGGYTKYVPNKEEKEESIEELTMEQLCKELGRTVKIIK